MKEVAILCPSLGKPEECSRFYDSVYATTDRADVMLMYDPADPRLPEYKYLGHMREPGEGFPQCIQRLWKRNPGYKYYMWGSDDLVMKEGWLDAILFDMDKYTDGVVVAWPDDGRHSLARHPIAGAPFVEALGWFAYPKLVHPYVDNIITDLARGLGRLQCCRRSVIEHRHKPFTNVWPPESETLAYNTYRNWYDTEREADLAKLFERIQCSSQ